MRNDGVVGFEVKPDFCASYDHLFALATLAGDGVAYLCQGTRCLPPMSSVEQVKQQLAAG